MPAAVHKQNSNVEQQQASEQLQQQLTSLFIRCSDTTTAYRSAPQELVDDELQVSLSPFAAAVAAIILGIIG